MKFLFRFFAIFSFLFLSTSLDVQATHIIGGNITYTCTGNNNYIVELTLYRDCTPGNAGFSPSSTLTVFNASTHASIATYSEAHNGQDTVDFEIEDPCIELPPNLCIEKVTHSYIINLPPSLDGYVLNHQVCCFASTVQNILNPTGIGLNVSATVPPVGGSNPTCFSAPVFNQDPLLTLCLYDELDEDFGATLPNPDPTLTLVHSFFTPDQDGGGSPDSPPFWQVDWAGTYTDQAPVVASPPLNLNPFTGELTGTITELGFFMFGIQVHVINDDGDTIAHVSRPFRYLVSDCNINRSIAELAAPTICGSLEVDFANGSYGADSYEWNFGDPTSASNITTQEEPTHIFSDYGEYTIQLITSAGSDATCSDTSFIDIVLENGAESNITVNNDNQCLSANSFDFQATSTKPNVTYTWDFGPNANIPTSTLPNPTGIIYNAVGNYTVTLTTQYNECETVETFNITVFDGNLSEFEGPTEGCVPFTAVFVPTVQNPTFTYTWSMDDETFVSDLGEYVFREPGVYDVQLYVYDENGCESTFIEEDYIEIFEIPNTGFDLTETHISEGEFVTITNTVDRDDYEIVFTMPDLGKTVDTHGNFAYTFHNEGVYEVLQTVTNGPCVTELTKYIHVGPPRVSPPNVFSPNNDQLNDFFYIDPFYNTNIEVHIYDRWGKEMFMSDNYELCNPESGEFCWDGTDKNGDKCVNGVYMYSVILPNGFKANGVVSLFR